MVYGISDSRRSGSRRSVDEAAVRESTVNDTDTVTSGNCALTNRPAHPSARVLYSMDGRQGAGRTIRRDGLRPGFIIIIRRPTSRATRDHCASAHEYLSFLLRLPTHTDELWRR
jgi:hypothetical protein